MSILAMRAGDVFEPLADVVRALPYRVRVVVSGTLLLAALALLAVGRLDDVAAWSIREMGAVVLDRLQPLFGALAKDLKEGG
ncbi:hypothetical protein ASE38_00265 [Cellulomonas sp. Root930]|nr:hypothetical protein ASE38_00265 [Cellulomonas sp. Root930]